MTGEPQYGTTEAAYRRWIGSLGPLSERQSAEAEQVYVLAAQLDTARSEGVVAAVAGISRELRQLSAGIRDVSVPASSAEQETPPPTGVADEVARRRAERRRDAS